MKSRKILQRYQLLLIAIVNVVLFTTVEARGNNNFFLKGDCFFHFTMTEAEIKNIDKAKDVVLRYKIVGKQAFGGNAGYQVLTIKNCPKSLKLRIKRAFYIARHFIPQQKKTAFLETIDGDSISIRKKETVVNPISFYIYNKEFSVDDRIIGLRYNENWTEDLSLFGFSSKHNPGLMEFINSRAAVEESWRNSKSTSALMVRLPDVKLAKFRACSTPLELSGEFKFVVPLTSIAKQLDIAVDNERTLLVFSKNSFSIYKSGAKKVKLDFKPMTSGLAIEKEIDRVLSVGLPGVDEDD